MDTVSKYYNGNNKRFEVWLEANESRDEWKIRDIGGTTMEMDGPKALARVIYNKTCEASRNNAFGNK